MVKSLNLKVSNPDFNSIKVRLEQAFYYLKPFIDLFQFHKGAIRTLISQLRECATIISIP